MMGALFGSVATPWDRLAVWMGGPFDVTPRSIKGVDRNHQHLRLAIAGVSP